MRTPIVFISSTSNDLREYRDAVRRACDELSIGVVGMEDFEAADLNAVRASLAKLDTATVYVGVFAHRYGFVPPGDHRSVTEQEFDHATKRGIERLCFVVDPKYPWPDDRCEHAAAERVAEFHRRVLGSGLVVRMFTTPDNLHHAVFLALQRYQQRRGSVPRQIPPPARDFVGREDDIRELLFEFDRGAAISGVHGQGGVGKTELARKVAQLIRDRYRDGDLFLDLHGFDPHRKPLSSEQILFYVASVLDQEQRLRVGMEYDELKGLYHTLLAGKRVLLFFDNASGPEQLTGLIPPPGCALLVTSRRHFSLPGLKPYSLDTLDEPAAVDLVRRLAGRLDESQARELVAMCGRLPLAVRLAGSLLGQREDLSVARYLELLRQARLTERTGLADVAASIRLSENALTRRVRAVWRELAAFRGGFVIPAACVLWQVDRQTGDDWIQELKRLSLLNWEAKTKKYVFHDLVREYTLGGQGEASAPVRKWQFVQQHLIERPLAFLLLVLALPVLLLIVLLTKLTSPGPAFYTQTRVGLRGRPFRIFKVRTLRHLLDMPTAAQWSIRGDARITSFGRFLRRTYLDELPQLWNIVLGEMSFVGPRPERPEFTPTLSEAIPLYEARLTVLPGLTGLAQIQRPADSDIDSVRKKLGYDLYYITHRNVWYDLCILIGTAFRLVGASYTFVRVLMTFPKPEVVRTHYEELIRE